MVRSQATTHLSGRVDARTALVAGAVLLLAILLGLANAPRREVADRKTAPVRDAYQPPATPADPAPTQGPAEPVAGTPAPSRPTRDHQPGTAFPSVPRVAPRGTVHGVEAKTVLALPWGNHPSAIGLFVPPEGGLPIGPASFAVGPDGRIYVADRVNRRITIFLPGGIVDRILDLEGNLADLAVDGEGRIHTLEYGTGAVQTLDARTGQAIAVTSIEELAVGREPVEGLVVRDGKAFVRRVDQSIRPIAEGAGGNWGRDAVVTAWPEKGQAFAEITSQDGAPAKGIAVEIDTEYVQGSVQYLGPDGKGGSYLLVETLAPDGGIESTVRRYDAEGGFRQAVSVPFRNLAQPDRTFVVDAQGELYQMTTSEEGVKIVRYPWD